MQIREILNVVGSFGLLTFCMIGLFTALSPLFKWVFEITNKNKNVNNEILLKISERLEKLEEKNK